MTRSVRQTNLDVLAGQTLGSLSGINLKGLHGLQYGIIGLQVSTFWLGLWVRFDYLAGYVLVWVHFNQLQLRDSTLIYCPWRRTWSSVWTLFPPGIEPQAVTWQSITQPLCHASSTWNTSNVYLYTISWIFYSLSLWRLRKPSRAFSLKS